MTQNQTRKDFITELIHGKNPDIIGFYRLTMKSGSDNFRTSSVQSIVRKLKSKGLKMIIYEPLFSENFFLGCEVMKDLNKFKELASIIVANRVSDELNDVSQKVFTRDLFKKN